jgi:hypothetical protein
LAWGLLGVRAARADVDIEWRPATQSVELEQMVEVGIYAVADAGADESIAAIQVIVGWDGSRLALWGNSDPCQDEVCPPDGYLWGTSGFPDDSAGDGLNNTFTDGEALFVALSPLGTETPALATAQGLWVTTLRFQTLRAGTTTIEIRGQAGTVTRTRVAAGESTGVDITGDLGPPAVVNVVGCPRPAVEAAGSRYLAVEPSPGPDPLALVVTGDIDNPDVSCVARYVQPDGTLGAAPVFQVPGEWGTVFVHGPDIMPAVEYHVQAGCGTGGVVEALSRPLSVTTWMWGDVDNNHHVYIDDVTAVLNGTQGMFGEGVTLQGVDLAPCQPDGIVDAADVQAIEAAYNGGAYPCAAPCGPGPTLEDLADFISCMAGPGMLVDVGCKRFDSDGDGDTDAVDFAAFQAAYDHPF